MMANSSKGSGVGKATKEAPSRVAPLQLLLSVPSTNKPLQHGLLYVAVMINGKEVLALLDTSATHNFLAESRATDLGLKVVESSC